MAAQKESSLSRGVSNALNEEKLTCQHGSCTAKNMFGATSEYLASNFRVQFSDNYRLYYIPESHDLAKDIGRTARS